MATMPESKLILIACPQHGLLVRGRYKAGPAGGYAVGPDGSFDLRKARCGQYSGRCMQTLCALHRFNRGGPGSWYPDRILATPAPKTSPRRPATTLSQDSTGGGLSVHA